MEIFKELLIAFLSLPWQFYAVLALPIVLPVLKRLIEDAIVQRKFARAGLSDVRRMHWREFEEYLAHLFRSLGYHVKLGPGSNDFGVDLILTDSNGRRTAVQAKHWNKKRVGSPDVNKTVGAAKGERCEEVLIITTSGYTNAAREAARRTGAQLWAIDELADAMARTRSRGPAGHVPAAATAAERRTPQVTTPAPKVAAPKQPARLAEATQSQAPQPLGVPAKKPAAPTGPACPQCGRPMVERRYDERPIWLCSGFPTCKGSKLKD